MAHIPELPEGAQRRRDGVVVGLVAPEAGLCTLPGAVASLTSPRRVDLDGNALTSVPASPGRLTRLGYLNLSGNGSPRCRTPSATWPRSRSCACTGTG